jgi:hypothetical protein
LFLTPIRSRDYPFYVMRGIDSEPKGSESRAERKSKSLYPGGLGEFAVFIDDQKVVNTNRLWYPNPAKVVRKVRALLTE